MSFGIYKRGQGRWSRGVAAGALVAMGLWGAIETYRWIDNYVYARWYVPGLILAGFLSLAYYLSNRPKPSDFLIDTEIEMKKVTWPTTREVFSATMVVIIVLVLLGAFLFSVDRWVLQPLLQWLGVLPGEVTPWQLIPTGALVLLMMLLYFNARTRTS
ncbi:MAG TPA: preprotein translocase subunit SecE [Planctomycetota bacterium]|nr:preprotein translocase subunit SecE [Planctomycetota bacterium]HUV39708.1 preprotein translocase subunit SecE [Planctomycetota bacterium]